MKSRIARSIEVLENRCMLAGDLIAQWTANDLNARHGSGDVVAEWTATIPNVSAKGVGQPQLIKNALNGNSVVRFIDQDEEISRFDIAPTDNPLSNANAFSVVVAFSTAADTLDGGRSNWFFNSGIVDAHAFGLSEDWGIAINAEGIVSGGMGRPAKSVYADPYPANDGLLLNDAMICVFRSVM